MGRWSRGAPWTVRGPYGRAGAPRRSPPLTAAEEALNEAGTSPSDRYDVDLVDLIDAGLLKPGALLIPRSGAGNIATVADAGTLQVGEEPYQTPTGAARANGSKGSGWVYWFRHVGDERMSLDEIRDLVLAGSEE